MTNRLRRTTLKGLTVTLPVAWASPIVASVVLPAHAQTSGCYAPAGCYPYGRGDVQAGVFHWPGGTGPAEATFYNNEFTVECIGEPYGTDLVVVATSAEEAAGLLGCGTEGAEMFEETVPSMPGCHFYVCAPF